MVTHDMPGHSVLTIGGAIANDIHGKRIILTVRFVNCVISFTILLAMGIQLIHRGAKTSDLFWANFGGLGIVGRDTNGNDQTKER